jgi:hypothetical protein
LIGVVVLVSVLNCFLFEVGRPTSKVLLSLAKVEAMATGESTSVKLRNPLWGRYIGDGMYEYKCGNENGPVCDIPDIQY